MYLLDIFFSRSFKEPIMRGESEEGGRKNEGGREGGKEEER